MCVFFHSCGIIFGQVPIWPRYGTVLLLVHVRILVSGCTVKCWCAEVMKRFQFSVLKIT